MKLGLIGKPLTHSYSNEIHSEIMKQNGINGTYELFEIEEKDLGSTIKKLKDSGYRGLNVTLPYKEKVLEFVDEIDEKSEYIGAINTIKFCDGKAYGYNTDYLGFISLLKDSNIDVKGKDAIILGAGGTARTAAKALIDSKTYDLTIVTRSKKEFHNLYSTSFDFITENPTNCDILINCTPVGMYPNMTEAPIQSSLIKTPIYIDLIYNPKRTKLMEQYEQDGSKVIGGYHMLVQQALESQRIWAT